MRYTGTPWAWRTLGFMVVTMWCSRSGWDWKSSLADSLMTASAFSAYLAGIPYHVLGSPQCRKLMDGVQWSSTCQQNVEKHIPTYNQGTFIPEMSMSICFRMELGTTGRLLRFHSESAYVSH